MVARRPRTRVEALERIAILAESYAAKDPILLGAFEVLQEIEADDETRRSEEMASRGRQCVNCGKMFLSYVTSFCSIGCQLSSR